MKFSSMKLTRSLSKLRCGKANDNNKSKSNKVSPQVTIDADVKWEMRPGGMLVQKRDIGDESVEDGIMVVRVATCSQLHDISIQATSTFGKSFVIIIASLVFSSPIFVTC